MFPIVVFTAPQTQHKHTHTHTHTHTLLQAILRVVGVHTHTVCMHTTKCTHICIAHYKVHTHLHCTLQSNLHHTHTCTYIHTKSHITHANIGSITLTTTHANFIFPPSLPFFFALVRCECCWRVLCSTSAGRAGGRGPHRRLRRALGEWVGWQVC